MKLIHISLVLMIKMKSLERKSIIPLFDGSQKKIEDILVGDILIGDDGFPRKVISTHVGNGKLYSVSSDRGETFLVSEEHKLVVRMNDHKVILWSDTQTAWGMLWVDKENKCVKSKKIRAGEIKGYICPICKIELHSSVKRHYSRLHKDVEVPKSERKAAVTVAPGTDVVNKAYDEMVEFAKSIPDDNTMELTVKEYLESNETIKYRYTAFIGECVRWEHKDVELDPYVLGLYLGDGSQTGYNFAITPMEKKNETKITK